MSTPLRRAIAVVLVAAVVAVVALITQVVSANVAAPAGTLAGESSAAPLASQDDDATLVLTGLDPVMLTEGSKEQGKPEIIATHEGWRYQFVSESTRARFAADVERYAVQNDTCLVVPGEPTDSRLFVVHDERIYLFATSLCVIRFNVDPEQYVEP